MKRKFVEFIFVIILVIIGGVVVKFVNESNEDTESTENVEIIEGMESTENSENVEDTERTDEEYISVLLDNQEDFDYVAEMMQEWPDRSIIVFKKDNIVSESPEIEEEIENNAEFYEHLKHLHDLDEILDIVKWSDWTEFCFRKPPKDYHGGWYYWNDMEEKGISPVYKIDEHWTLEMLPNV